MLLKEGKRTSEESSIGGYVQPSKLLDAIHGLHCSHTDRKWILKYATNRSQQNEYLLSTPRSAYCGTISLRQARNQNDYRVRANALLRALDDESRESSGKRIQVHAQEPSVYYLGPRESGELHVVSRTWVVVV